MHGDALTPVAAQVLRLRDTHGNPITRSWSANFEDVPYPDQPELILQDAIQAIGATRVSSGSGVPFVNLITPGPLGDPAGYLIPALRQALGESVAFEEAGQCDCGGYVVRCWRLA